MKILLIDQRQSTSSMNNFTAGNTLAPNFEEMKSSEVDKLSHPTVILVKVPCKAF